MVYKKMKTLWPIYAQEDPLVLYGIGYDGFMYANKLHRVPIQTIFIFFLVLDHIWVTFGKKYFLPPEKCKHL